MTRAGPSESAARAAATYETLRAAVLSGRSNGQPGLAIIIHRGLTAWIGELTPEASATTASFLTSGPPIRSTAPTSTPNELTRVLAGIIVALTTGDASAHA